MCSQVARREDETAREVKVLGESSARPMKMRDNTGEECWG